MALPMLDLQIRGFSKSYPYQIWCLWALEERINALNNAVIWLEDTTARDQCISDLDALAQWPRYSSTQKGLNLPYAHAVQLMAKAFKYWTWLPDKTREKLNSALLRAVEEGILMIPAAVRSLTSAEELLDRPSPHQHLHNISLITQAALANAAEVIDHPDRRIFSSTFHFLFEARLSLHCQGLTEGISYDGYFYNFALSWLATQSELTVNSILEHSAWQDLENQVLGLACPGQIAQSAEIGDVEPLQMTFIWSTLARLQHWVFSPVRDSLLEEVSQEFLRSDALFFKAQQSAINNKVKISVSATGKPKYPNSSHVQQCNAAVTLASGLSHNDLSVVISLCLSPMNHIQPDSGTLLIGHAGKWWVTDPGYQQYLKNSERDFTLGNCAHNTPVINGHGQSHKAGKLLFSGATQLSTELSCLYALIDITGCFSREANVKTVSRAIWRIGAEHVVVCDTIQVDKAATIFYHWHCDADAYWGETSGSVTVNLPSSNRTLWIQSGQQALSLAQQHRLRGSRGQCTLKTIHNGSTIHHWWSFSFGDTPKQFKASGVVAQLGSIKIALEDVLPKTLPTPELEVIIHPYDLHVTLRSWDELLGSDIGSYWDFNLSVNGQQQYSLVVQGRHCWLPIPLIKVEDSILLSSTSLPPYEGDTKQINRYLTESEKKAILSIPLRVYVESANNLITGRCSLMPGVIEGDLEYAFYLIVDGQKSQVQWYQANSFHSFKLLPEDTTKALRVRGFVRSTKLPDLKLNALSAPLEQI